MKTKTLRITDRNICKYRDTDLVFDGDVEIGFIHKTVTFNSINISGNLISMPTINIYSAHDISVDGSVEGGFIIEAKNNIMIKKHIDTTWIVAGNNINCSSISAYIVSAIGYIQSQQGITATGSVSADNIISKERISAYAINAHMDILTEKNIIASRHIEAGRDIRARLGIEAGDHIFAGRYIKVGFGIFAGINTISPPTLSISNIHCKKLLSGQIAYGNLLEITNTEETQETNTSIDN